MTATRRDFAKTAALAPLALTSMAFAESSGSGQAPAAAAGSHLESSQASGSRGAMRNLSRAGR